MGQGVDPQICISAPDLLLTTKLHVFRGECKRPKEKQKLKRERNQRFKLVGNENSFQLMGQEKPNIHILKKKKKP